MDVLLEFYLKSSEPEWAIPKLNTGNCSYIALKCIIYPTMK